MDGATIQNFQIQQDQKKQAQQPKPKTLDQEYNEDTYFKPAIRITGQALKGAQINGPTGFALGLMEADRISKEPPTRAQRYLPFVKEQIKKTDEMIQKHIQKEFGPQNRP